MIFLYFLGNKTSLDCTFSLSVTQTAKAAFFHEKGSNHECETWIVHTVVVESENILVNGNNELKNAFCQSSDSYFYFYSPLLSSHRVSSCSPQQKQRLAHDLETLDHPFDILHQQHPLGPHIAQSQIHGALLYSNPVASKYP